MVPAGPITVNAEAILVSGAASPETDAGREFGDSLHSRIASENFGNGAGGDITVQTQDLNLLNGGRIATVVGPATVGNGGNITVDASSNILVEGVNPFSVDSASGISTFTFGGTVFLRSDG